MRPTKHEVDAQLNLKFDNKGRIPDFVLIY
jgi:hypothetical protein